MNSISAYLKKAGRALSAAALLCSVLTACDSVIYDDEGDCSVTYRVTFRYDRNMKWADAFPNEVKSVHLYAFDKAGVLVWQNAEKGEALASYDYAMKLDLPPGDYHLLAWCGLENDGEREESFSVPEAVVGQTRLEELKCRLRRDHDAEGAFSNEKLYPLFHGSLDVTLPDMTLEGGSYTCSMPLTKDTNHVRIILQHLSGEEVNPNDFNFRIEEENGLMAHDNSLLPDELIIYRAHDKTSGTASMEIDDYPEWKVPRTAAPQKTTITSVSVAIADLTIARLMEGRKTWLTIEKVGDPEWPNVRIPLTDFALLIKDGYDHAMSDQEYFDRQDEYSLTFFLDEDHYWVSSSVIINSWRVVLDNVDFGES